MIKDYFSFCFPPSFFQMSPLGTSEAEGFGGIREGKRSLNRLSIKLFLTTSLSSQQERLRDRDTNIINRDFSFPLSPREGKCPSADGQKGDENLTNLKK